MTVSAYDVMNDFRRRYGWLALDQLQYVLDFIDSQGEGLALLEYLKGQVLKCICGECEALGHFFTCDKCGRPTPWCRGADDDYPGMCDDCAVEN